MEAKPDVLILDPVGTLAESAAPILRRNGYAVRVTGAAPPSIRTPASPDVAIVDACSLGGQSIPRLVTALRRSGARAVLQVSGCAAVQEACRCHPDRADAYLLRPLYDGELLETVAGLTHRDGDGRGFHGMIGTSPAMRRVFDEIRRVAPTDSVVLITGETGTGKELVARALHALSGRVEGPFVPVDCTALSSSLLES
ncbi:MAG TPA: sigma 54-interacting transcriptional regulator, partial [Longimicrobiales bacterium]|nr:sigma 54-interacting transcriptional regulator [Longimicrobiales bacterium]